jgi:hypothetical protein
MKPFVSLKLSLVVVWNLILKTNKWVTFTSVFMLYLFVLQWLFSLDQLVDIVFGNNNLTLLDRVDFLFDGFLNIFKYANDFIPMAMILISLMQAVNITLLIHYKTSKSVRNAQGLAISLSAVGVGCVACGGSVITPILGFFASTISVTVAESISRLLLLAAIVVSYISMNRMTFIVAKTIHKQK